MKKTFTYLLAIVCLSSTIGSAVAQNNWEQSLVMVEVTHKQYNYILPWQTSQQRSTIAGIVIGEREILTTADQMDHPTLIRLQKGGRGQWYTGQIKWIDPTVNLALITTDEDMFWEDLSPVEMANEVDSQADMRIVRWSDGLLEQRRSEFKRFVVERGRGNPNMVNHVHIELTSEIQGVGWGEPLIIDNAVVGMLVSHDNSNDILAIPAPFITNVLNAARDDSYKGLGYFDFFWQPGENPSLLRHLGLTNENIGVVVIDIPPLSAETSVLQKHDVILQIDGFDIDIQGDYLDPDYGYLMLENLSSRNHWAGEQIEMKIWRDESEQTVQYTLPAISPDAELVPNPSSTEPPKYMIVGGLVFQPLSRGYLQSLGGGGRRGRAPFRLAYYETEYPTEETPSLVVLSGVWPDPYNQGYQDLSLLALEEVNGRKIRTIQDLAAAFENPTGEFHEINFREGAAVNRIVMDVEGANDATQRIIQAYGIPSDRMLD